MSIVPVWASDATVLCEAKAQFQRGKYTQTLELLRPLNQKPNRPLEALRLTVASLARIERPVEALAHYETLSLRLGRDDLRLLREVAIGFILPVRKDMRDQMRGAAYTALKELAADDTVPYFEEGLSDGSGLVRALAAEGLAKVKTGRHSARLHTALEDDAALVRVAALKAIARSGERGRLSLVKPLLTDEQPIVRVAALGALVMLGEREYWDRLIQAARSADAQERGSALRLLGEVGDQRARPTIQAALEDSQPSVRGAAISALGSLGDKQAGAALVPLLRDPVAPVRVAAAMALGKFPTKEVQAALAQALKDGNPIVQAAAASSLLRRGRPFQEVAGVVFPLIRHADPGVRAFLARGLGKSRGKNRGEAIQVLQTLLKDPVPRTRIAAARALGRIGELAALPLLKQALTDADEAVRATVGGAIGRLASRGLKTKRD